MYIRALSLDCAFTHLGYTIFDIGAGLAIRHNGVIMTEDQRPKTNPKIVETVDPKTGLTVIKKGKRSRKGPISDEDTRRATEWCVQLCCLIKEHNIQCIFAELPAGSQSAVAAKCLGMAKNGCIMAAVAFDLPYIWVSPNDVKREAKKQWKDKGRDVKNPNKEDIMELVLDMYQTYEDWPMKHFKNGRPSELIKDQLEHIADSVIVAFAAVNKPEYLEIRKSLI